MNKLVYPTGVRVSVKLVKKGKSVSEDRFRYFYEESFADVDETTMTTTFDYAEPLLLGTGLKLRRGKRFFRVSGIVPRTVIGDWMVGEFMHWSTVGTIPLRKIFESATVGEILSRTLASSPRPFSRKPRAPGPGSSSRKPRAPSPKPSS